jgi:hypothetical protein
MALTPFVRVRTQIEGLHHWPDAPPPDRYLAAPHRHLFVTELDLEVRHDDREIEINALTRWITDLLPTFAQAAEPGAAVDFGAQSCEQLATRLIQAVLKRHGRDREIRATVLEDGILGGGVHWRPEPARRP